jgi:predicted NAD/FAD-binding protein
LDQASPDWQRAGCSAGARRHPLTRPTTTSAATRTRTTSNLGGRNLAVDTGFHRSVNPDNYPLCVKTVRRTRGRVAADDDEFRRQERAQRLEYNATNLAGTVFCQKRNLGFAAIPAHAARHRRFLRADAGCWYAAMARSARYLEQGGYRPAMFRDDHIVPMASRCGRRPFGAVLQFPARYVLAFIGNHRMLQARRPAAVARRQGADRNATCARCARDGACASAPVAPDGGPARPDGVASMRRRAANASTTRYFACHSDQALSLLKDARDTRTRHPRRDHLAVPTTPVLHTNANDASVLPKRPQGVGGLERARAGGADRRSCTVSYLHEPAAIARYAASRIVRVAETDRSHRTGQGPAGACVTSIRSIPRRHGARKRASTRSRGRRSHLVRRSVLGRGFHEDGCAVPSMCHRFGVDAIRYRGRRVLRCRRTASRRQVATTLAVRSIADVYGAA